MSAGAPAPCGHDQSTPYPSDVWPAYGRDGMPKVVGPLVQAISSPLGYVCLIAPAPTPSVGRGWVRSSMHTQTAVVATPLNTRGQEA